MVSSVFWATLPRRSTRDDEGDLGKQIGNYRADLVAAQDRARDEMRAHGIDVDAVPTPRSPTPANGQMAEQDAVAAAKKVSPEVLRQPWRTWARSLKSVAFAPASSNRPAGIAGGNVTVINTRIIVAPDGAVSVADPLPAGEHPAAITLIEPGKRPSILDLKVHHGPWDDSVSLRREDMYGDDGRCVRFSSTRTR